MIGEYSMARQQLVWEPRTRFVDLVSLVVDADVDLMRRQHQGEIT